MEIPGDHKDPERRDFGGSASILGTHVWEKKLPVVHPIGKHIFSLCVYIA